ncbi:site-specific recombinase XerD [Kribbella sp. VKM Ac-2571]|uniref:tyrosine-type recombinase/integrase n=1 Tax=Kribbella sp. VKM Ac-2571 TaxID=2512222 RepID=UPI00105D232C|nr:tyrosine-type recombinase/integrase [Kribbella sp. VKM Ac-2571]TDO62594.1 site-specific recombinase XerD [Kribbella sp. VKM Ac-2571]
MGAVKDGITKRGRTWSYVIRVTDPATGASKPKWVGGFATEDDAKEARDEARRAARRGEYIDRSGMTVTEYLGDWLDAHAMETKPRTLAGYRWLVRQYVNPHIGRLRIQAVRPTSITNLYRTLLKSGGRDGRGLSEATVWKVHAVLRKAFKDAVLYEGILPSNPVERAKRPRRDSHVLDVWTPAQLRAFLQAATSHRLYAFYRLAAYTGARRGELLNLRWADVDLKAPTIRIRGSVGMVEGERVEGTTKGGRERVVSLDAGTVAILQAHERQQAADRAVVGDAWANTGHVFTNGLGVPIYPDTVTQLMPKIIRAHNQPDPDDPSKRPADLLPSARLHDLRHVHATMLLTAGVPVHVVAERLGHADPSITLRVYAHVIRQHAAGVADTFAAAVDQPDEDDPPAAALAPR